MTRRQRPGVSVCTGEGQVGHLVTLDVYLLRGRLDPTTFPPDLVPPAWIRPPFSEAVSLLLRS